jgi:hypothetical protein
MGNQIIYNFIDNVLPENIKYEDLPELKHKEEFVGDTDYIDNIFPRDISHRVMRGIDHFNRKYIVVYYNENIQTYFQRYTGNENCWSYGEFTINHYNKILYCSGNIATQLDSMATIKKVITELLKSNFIENTENTNLFSNSSIENFNFPKYIE